MSAWKRTSKLFFNRSSKIIFVKLKSQPQHHQRMKDSNEQDIYIHTHQKNKDKQGNE